MKTKKIFSRIIDGMILLIFILLLSSAGFQDKNTSGWYQQWLPNLNGSTITDITFLDSLTGFAVTNTNSLLQAYILKTTNGGDNWNIINTYIPPSVNSGFTRIQFANSNIGYASTNYFDFFKTTNAGINWSVLTTPWGGDDMAVINIDTVLLVDYAALMGGVYRSTNGGINWTRIWTGGTVNPDGIYMFDKNLGFIKFGSYPMQRTTNGGFNWSLISGEFYGAIKFHDSNTGWKIYDSLKKTTNAGLNWTTQITPNISYSFNYPLGFSIVNKDTVWMVGARKWQKPPVYKTTNGGLNWGYQFPDTTLQIYKFGFIQFVNTKVGWINPASPTSLMHTTTGGNDTTFYTSVNNNTVTVPEDYVLEQNYPNPFNQSTMFKFQCSITGNVKINVYDISGKKIRTLVNATLNPGAYQYRFDSGELTSGVYFYSLIANGKVIDTRRMILIK